jgi:hypothetical protein
MNANRRDEITFFLLYSLVYPSVIVSFLWFPFAFFRVIRGQRLRLYREQRDVLVSRIFIVGRRLINPSSVPMKLLVALLALASLASVHAAEPWGQSPPASDDRFSNPSKPLYAGPDGWWNTGEVRAQVTDTAKTRYAYKGSFSIVHNEFISVGGPDKLQTEAEKGSCVNFGQKRIFPENTYEMSEIHMGAFADLNKRRPGVPFAVISNPSP